MKKFRVTVNGQSYDVEVEEMGGTAAPVSQPPVAAPAPAPAPAPAAAPQPVAASPAAEPVAAKGPIPEGAITVKAPMSGKISALKAETGKPIKRGDVIMLLEAMKMQNDITANADGTLQEIRFAVGDNVKTGDVLAVITQ